MIAGRSSDCMDTMSQIEPNNLVSCISEASTQGYSIDSTTTPGDFSDPTTQTDATSASSIRPAEPTLLGIPRELRNKIFGYVYDALGTTHERIDLGVAAHCFKGQALIASHQSPPSKNPILACRQIYSEMRGMQIAAWRQYWTTNTFYVSRCPNTITSANPFTTSDQDLQHIKHFVVFQQLCPPGGVGVDIDFEKATPITAVDWRGSVGVPADYPILDRNGNRSRLLNAVMASLGLGSYSHDRRAIPEPEIGLGLTSADLMMLVSQVSCTLYGREAVRCQVSFPLSTSHKERNLVRRAWQAGRQFLSRHRT